ncbi:DUF413 domain-containing protein [Pelagibaculum spongiae]|uniref:Macrodomain Ori protein n=1 Tax=Pelagibaculum spongiae TaxID=2080658 RepID=A0A2V1GYB2_9GAMM|nr:DUF413 domain-containing protein [Pelagibaculum spongiae]PVZ65640.1 hypothetical protein DC094_17285 [Pelagibaculum spongiae]
MQTALSSQERLNKPDETDQQIVPGKRWNDHKNYPRGFDRSGDFTIQQAKLLETYGSTISQLVLGKRIAENAAEQRMLEVIAGHQAAETVLEKLWLLYLDCTKKRNMQMGLCTAIKDNSAQPRKQTASALSASSQLNQNDQDAANDDDIEVNDSNDDMQD